MCPKTECSGVFQNGFFFSSPARSGRGFFFNIYCGNLFMFLETNFTILQESSYDLVSLEFLTLRFVPAKPPAIHQSSDFPSWAVFLPLAVSIHEYMLW